MKKTVTELLQIRDAAHAAHEAEKARLADLGLNSKQRYGLLKDLKAAVDAAHAEYTKAAKARMSTTLRSIEKQQAAENRAAKIARSPWKAAKAAAGTY